MTKYIDFEMNEETSIKELIAALNQEEKLRLEAVETKYSPIFDKWKEEEKTLKLNNPEWASLIESYNEERFTLFDEVQERRFTEIIKNIGIEKFFQDRIKAAETEIKKVIDKNKDLETKVYTDYGLNEVIKNYKEIIEVSQNVLGKTKHIKKEDIQDLGYTEILEMLGNSDLKASNLLEIPKTKFPNEFITPKDKVSNMLFNGQLSEELQPLRMERLNSKKELTAKVSIEFDDLKAIKLSNRNITPYDREVHDAVVSLYIDGKNEYVTPLMIYRTMTGNPNGKLTEKILNEISEAIERCSRTRVYIDATGEVEGKGYNIQQPIFKENLLYTRSIKGLHNGKMGEWIQIIQPPILYKYANSKNQVARMDIKLLNTPVNKNEETIILQGYLQRRVLTMKGSNLSKNILYETVYKQLNIEATSPGALRKKQNKVRDNIKTILDYWKEENFIADYKENTGPRNAKISITIILN